MCVRWSKFLPDAYSWCKFCARELVEFSQIMFAEAESVDLYVLPHDAMRARYSSSLFAYTSYAENVPLHAFARRCCRNRSVSHALPGPAEGCKAAATGLLLRAMLERRDGRTSCRFIDIDHAPHTQLAVPETPRVWTTSCRRVYVTLGLCYNEIRVSPKTRVLFSGTLSLPNSGFRKFRPGN